MKSTSVHTMRAFYTTVGPKIYEAPRMPATVLGLTQLMSDVVYQVVTRCRIGVGLNFMSGSGHELAMIASGFCRSGCG